jgi:putative membrane protein
LIFGASRPGLKRFLQSWLINTLAVLVAVYIVKGIRYEKPLDLCVASLLLGILNTFLRPILVIFALPLVLVTLGLFLLAINALVLYFVGFLLRPHFYVVDFASAFWGALIISLVSLLLNSLIGGGPRVRIERGGRRGDSGKDDDGPAIDV